MRERPLTVGDYSESTPPAELSPFHGQDVTKMDDETLSSLVDTILQAKDLPTGAYQAHDSAPGNAETEKELHKKYLMASLRRGKFSAEPIAVDASGQLDVEYGNSGPEISMQQQMTNTGRLTSVNYEEIGGTKKQQRYRFLSAIIGSSSRATGPLKEELEALEEDDEVHSVSAVSGAHDLNPEHYKPCAIDCWLKNPNGIPEFFPLPDLSSSPDLLASSTDANDAFIYGKLEPDESRLVCLQPGRYGNTIVCNLSVMVIPESTSLGGTSTAVPQYEALSYTWGDPTPIFRIECNGKPLLIPRNLFFALQYLRYEAEPRYLWVDAICIDQKETNERSEQVLHMLDIYKNASRVIVWLGEESEDSHLAMVSMNHLDQREQRKDITFRVHDEGCYNKLKRLCEAQCQFFERPWFRRGWIRQEISVAKDIVVVCGRDTIGWYPMKRSAARLQGLYNKLRREGVADVSEFRDEQATAISCLTRGWILGQSVIKLIGCIGSIWYNHTGGLLDLLISGRGYGTTDERDKVYSVLGLARVLMTTSPPVARLNSITTPFPIDYSKSISEVYQDVVKYFINRDRNLDILSILLTHRNASSDDDLPSWVPDWRVPASEIPVTANWDFLSLKVAAGGFKTEALPQSHEETGILRVQAHVFDAIDEIEEYTASVYDALRTLPEFEGGGDEEGADGQLGQPVLYAEPFNPEKHRTKCCATSLGSICVAPANVQVGDVIAIFLGAKHPFIVRPQSPASDTGTASSESAEYDRIPPAQIDLEFLSLGEPGTPQTVTVVGPCVIPQLMFGRMVRVAREKNIAPQEFILV